MLTYTFLCVCMLDVLYFNYLFQHQYVKLGSLNGIPACWLFDSKTW